MNKVNVIVILILIGFLGLISTIFTVDERQKALVFRFGKIVQEDVDPGLNFKIPMIENVQYFDARIQTTDLQEESYLTLEKKNLIVDSFVKWRVSSPVKFYVNVSGSKASAATRLTQRVNDSLRQEFGKRSVKEVVSGDRVKIMTKVQEAVNGEAAAIGIEVIDVRLKRVDLDPDVIRDSVYPRMEAERQRVATELRAKGQETASIIRAEADRIKEITLAEAYRKSETLRGEGDAEATRVFAEAFGEDKEFYKIFRSLNAYKNTFDSKSDLLIVDPNSEFFDYFKGINNQ